MYEAESVEVGAEESVPITTLGPTGVIVQNLAGEPVTLGGPGVKAGHGLRLAVEDGWQPLPGGYASVNGLGQKPQVLELHGITESGTARVAFLRHNLPSS